MLMKLLFGAVSSIQERADDAIRFDREAILTCAQKPSQLKLLSAINVRICSLSAQFDAVAAEPACYLHSVSAIVAVLSQ